MKKGKFQKAKSKHMNPAAESWVLKAMFALILGVLLLIFRNEVVDFFIWVFGTDVIESPIFFPAAIIIFAAVATIGGMLFAFKTEAGDKIRQRI